MTGVCQRAVSGLSSRMPEAFTGETAAEIARGRP
jgi:hypothetical protein